MDNDYHKICTSPDAGKTIADTLKVEGQQSAKILFDTCHEIRSKSDRAKSQDYMDKVEAFHSAQDLGDKEKIKGALWDVFVIGVDLESNARKTLLSEVYKAQGCQPPDDKVPAYARKLACTPEK